MEKTIELAVIVAGIDEEYQNAVLDGIKNVQKDIELIYLASALSAVFFQTKNSMLENITYFRLLITRNLMV